MNRISCCLLVAVFLFSSVKLYFDSVDEGAVIIKAACVTDGQPDEVKDDPSGSLDPSADDDVYF